MIARLVRHPLAWLFAWFLALPFLIAYDYASAFNFRARPTGPRVRLRQYPLSPATKAFLATHPDDTNDPT